MTREQLLASLTVSDPTRVEFSDGSRVDWSSAAGAVTYFEVGDADGADVMLELTGDDLLRLHAALTAHLIARTVTA